jgi:hypothetical protein
VSANKDRYADDEIDEGADVENTFSRDRKNVLLSKLIQRVKHSTRRKRKPKCKKQLLFTTHLTRLKMCSDGKYDNFICDFFFVRDRNSVCIRFQVFRIMGHVLYLSFDPLTAITATDSYNNNNNNNNNNLMPITVATPCKK